MGCPSTCLAFYFLKKNKKRQRPFDFHWKFIKEAKEIFINSKEPYNIATKKEEEIIYLYLARKLFNEKLKEDIANKILTILSAIIIDLCIDYIKKNKIWKTENLQRFLR